MSAIRRWRARRPEERRAVIEALVTLAVLSARVRLRPFRSLARGACRPVGTAPPPDPEATIALVAWAVRAAARRARFRTVCIEQGLAAQAMLRRRGVAATLHYGVAKEAGDLSAHVWVRWRDVDVVGCEEAPRFRLVASFAPAG